MTYRFTALEAKVKTLGECLPNSPETKNAVTELLQEIYYQRKGLELVLLEPFSEDELKEFTGIHHRGLLVLVANLHEQVSDLLFKNKKRCDLKNADKSASLAMAYSELHQLLKFMHTYFDAYISKEKFIPSFCHKAFAREIQEFQKYTVKQLKNVNPELLEIVIKPFVDFVKTPIKQTWHSFFYCHFLFNEFKIWVDGGLKITETDLISFLFLVNFNSPEFCNYYADKLEEVGLDLEGLYRLKKEIILKDIRRDFAYKREREGLIEHFRKWLEEQITYQQQVGTIMVPRVLRDAKVKGTLEYDRLIVNVGIEKICYKLKVAADLGIFDTGVKEHFYEFLAQHISTVNAKYPSANSIGKGFREVKQSTKESELDYHVRAIKYIKDDINGLIIKGAVGVEH